MPRKFARPASETARINVNAIIIPSWARDIDRSYLAESVQSRGTIVPIVVAKIRGDRSGKYILVDGRGRLEQARLAEEKFILARIVQVENEEEALLIALELEHTKKPWDPEYTLKVIKYLEQKGYNRKQIADMLHIPRSTLYRILKLEQVEPEIREKVVKGEIPLRALDSEKELQKYVQQEEQEKPEEEPEEVEEITIEEEEEPKITREKIRKMLDEVAKHKEEQKEEQEKKYVTVEDIKVEKKEEQTHEEQAPEDYVSLAVNDIFNKIMMFLEKFDESLHESILTNLIARLDEYISKKYDVNPYIP